MGTVDVDVTPRRMPAVCPAVPLCYYTLRCEQLHQCAISERLVKLGEKRTTMIWAGGCGEPGDFSELLSNLHFLCDSVIANFWQIFPVFLLRTEFMVLAVFL